MTQQKAEDKTAIFVPLTGGTEIGSYRLIRELGVGGMGQVFLAEDTRLERQVALKFLATQFAHQDDFLKRFLREAKSAAKLNHSNIVTIHEVAEADDRVFISMEYVVGKSLREMIDTRLLGYDQALEVFLQICDGLKKAHDNEIVHRDLKPSNIMVTEDSRIKILDFGLAKGTLDANITSTGAALGTINYMSPEQTQGAGVDHRSDIFSAGIILFELLSGVNPFVRGHMPGTIHAIMYEPAGQLHSYNADLPADAQLIVEKALAKKAGDRYQSVADLIDDINRLKAGESITPGEISQPRLERTGTPGLAVLYLQNLGSEDDDFLSHGITEDLIVDLSRLGSVKVVPMRKILKYKDTSIELEDIAKQLNVTMVLDGSIHRSGDKVRISAQLVDVTSDDILWSNRWEESQDSIPKIKSALADGISKAMSVDSSVVRKGDVGKAESSNPEAYEHYLKGKFAFESRKKKDDVIEAQRLFQKALELEPNMFAARLGLAKIHAHEFELDEALAIIKPALAEAERLGLKADQAKAGTVYGAVLNRKNEYEEGGKVLRVAIAQFKELKDPSGELEATTELLKILLNTGKNDEVIALEPVIQQLAAHGTDDALVSNARLHLAIGYLGSGEPVKCMTILEDVLQLARANALVSLEARALDLLGGMYATRGGKYFATALAYLEEARYLSERLDDKKLVGGLSVRYQATQLAGGQFRGALETIAQSEVQMKELADTLGMSSCLINKTAIYTLFLDHQRAEETIAKIFEQADLFEGRLEAIIRGWGHVLRAYNLFNQGDYDQALAEFETSRKSFKDSGSKSDLYSARVSEGEARALHGDYAGAEPLLTIPADAEETKYDLDINTRSRGYLAFIKAANGDYDTGVRELRSTVESAEGHYTEVAASRLLGHVLIEHGPDEQAKSEGRRVLLKAMGTARTQENKMEMRLIQEILERAEI